MMNQDDFERLLRQSRPQADAHFQRALEDKLVARLQERKIKMNGTLRIPLKSYGALPQEKKYPSRPLSVTLAAAVMVVLLLAGIFYSMKPDGGETLPGAAKQQSATPTAIPSLVPSSTSTPFSACTLVDGYPYYLTRPGETVESIAAIFDVPVEAILAVNCFPADIVLGERQMILIPIAGTPPAEATLRLEEVIVVTATALPPLTPTFVPTVVPPELKVVVMARQDIPAGTLIIEEMLTEVLWPADSAPDNSFDSWEEVVGKTAAEDIERWDFLQPDQVEG